MTEPTEPGPFAEGSEPIEQAECRVAQRLILLPISLVIIIALDYFAWGPGPHIFRKSRAGLQFEAVVLGFVLIIQIIYNARYRVLADATGVRWRGLWREKAVNWDEITNYCLKWQVNYMPPVAEGGAGGAYSINKMRYLRMPRPEHLLAVIETKRGTLKLTRLVTGREPLCQMVRQRATQAEVRHWETKEYRMPGGSRTFEYEVPSWWMVAFRILTNRFSLAMPLLANYIFLFVLILTRFNRYALAWGLLVCALLVVGGYAVSAEIYLKWRRECQNRQGEKLIVTQKQFIRDTPGARVALDFEDVIDLRQERELWLFGRTQAWLARTATAEIPFFVRGLKDGNGLPAMIYSRSPRLWMKLEPIASPVPAPEIPAK